MENLIKKLSKSQKIVFLIVIICFIFLLSLSIPSLARYKNRNIFQATVWDGSIANCYKKGNGTKNNPYIISNGSELAYFSSELATNSYDNTYFSLSNDIIINQGKFIYDVDGIQYALNDKNYYIDSYTNKYYETKEKTGTEKGTVNLFNQLSNFKGIFNGNSFRIYGLYITDEEQDSLALFTNLEGTVKNLYVENAMIYGGVITGGVSATTMNATITDTLFDGYVIGRTTNLTKTANIDLNISPINVQTNEITSYIDLTNNMSFEGSEILSTSITGNYSITNDDDVSIKINGIEVSGGSFDINLGDSILNNIPLSVVASNGAILTLSNLNYNITYNYGVSGGIIANANNTYIKNTINKGFVYGNSVSGGLIGSTTNLVNISQSYNVGDINSNYISGGIIGVVEKSSNDSTLSKTYSTGELTSNNVGGLISVIKNNSGSITIDDSFSSNNYFINTIESSNVNLNNCYYVQESIYSGVPNGNLTKTSLTDLKEKNYLLNNLGYSEFITEDDLQTNNQNVWVYEENEYPILYIDDTKNDIASIYAGTYSWNNLSTNLNEVKYTSNITFSINQNDDLIPIKEKYYYISKSSLALTNEQIENLDWQSFDDIIQITEEGKYVIYAKVIDYNDKSTYLNTDVLVLDLPGISSEISIKDKSWTNFRNNLGRIYISDSEKVTINVTDLISDIKNIQYYVADEVKEEDELSSLSEWLNYEGEIDINNIGKHIVYAKITDSFDYVTYLNTDYIFYDGFMEDDLIVGRNKDNYTDSNYVSRKSVITLNIKYTQNIEDLLGYTHNLVSNTLLPDKTKITLIDNKNQKFYSYNTTSTTNSICNEVCKYIYPFTLFKEISNTNYYADSSYRDDNFTLILDFSNADINTDYSNIGVYLELYNTDNSVLLSTLTNSIKYFNIVDGAANLYLKTNNSIDSINFNSNSTTSISLDSGITYQIRDNNKIYDTTYEDKTIGLLIKFVDSSGNIIDNSYLKNMTFIIDNNSYHPSSDNLIRVNLKNGLNDVSKVLNIITYENNSNLKSGNYFLQITNYASYDGYNYDGLGQMITIPVKVNNNKVNYSFDVIMDDNNRIIDKKNQTETLTFDILGNGTIKNPNVKVSLYKKDLSTAYNQDYSIVNLTDYTSDTLEQFDTNVYNAVTNLVKYNGNKDTYNKFIINLKTNSFENNGYKFIFDLYDGNKKISSIEKHFIVK